MSNPFYAPGEQRAEKVHALFATIARRYDLINDVQSFGMHRRWKRRLVALANVKPGDRALDICCGTGDIAFALAAQGAEVVGLDFTEQMLAVAASKVHSLKSNVHSPQSTAHSPQFVRGDAMKLPFPDDSFDAVTVGYGLRNLVSWETGLNEMIRVARPGGHIVVLDFGKPDHALWRTIYFGYLRLCVPVFGLLFAGRADAYAYILESLKHYPAQRGVEANMREHGMKNVRVVNLIGGAMSFNYGEKPA
jgi:demethylmenaquinone methyltransferase/2-methoxy-6-polyprenyl-1,4-benzoquinol methylase